MSTSGPTGIPTMSLQVHHESNYQSKPSVQSTSLYQSHHQFTQSSTSTSLPVPMWDYLKAHDQS